MFDWILTIANGKKKCEILLEYNKEINIHREILQYFDSIFVE